jgi:hypothetical protein
MRVNQRNPIGSLPGGMPIAVAEGWGLRCCQLRIKSELTRGRRSSNSPDIPSDGKCTPALCRPITTGCHLNPGQDSRALHGRANSDAGGIGEGKLLQEIATATWETILFTAAEGGKTTPVASVFLSSGAPGLVTHSSSGLSAGRPCYSYRQHSGTVSMSLSPGYSRCNQWLHV